MSKPAKPRVYRVTEKGVRDSWEYADPRQAWGPTWAQFLARAEALTRAAKKGKAK